LKHFPDHFDCVHDLNVPVTFEGIDVILRHGSAEETRDGNPVCLCLKRLKDLSMPAGKLPTKKGLAR